MKYQRSLTGALAVTLAAAMAAPASAAVIASGGGAYQVGIAENGELYDASAGVGFLRTGDGFDVIAPGVPRDSWGINGVAADGQYLGSTVATTSIVAGPNGAVATTDTGIGFDVVQTYSFAGGGNILVIDTVVTNTSGDILAATFQRNVDWDIFSAENVFGPIGSANGVIDSSYFGFESGDPASAYISSCYFGCNATGDLGGGIKINLGSLNSGASRHFTYYYGIGGDVGGLIGDAQAAGAKYLIAAQGDGDADHSAIIGVSGAVPEPTTWAMLLLGFFGLGSMVRRRRAVVA
jgi:hypothetical protein